MRCKSLICLLILTFVLASCKKDKDSEEPEIDPAEELYGIWNRIEFGFKICEDPFDNKTQFGEGSVSFAKGGFYSTYSLRNGADRIITVRFEVQSDSLLFLTSQMKWKYEVMENDLELTRNATNGCVHYFTFKRSSETL